MKMFENIQKILQQRKIPSHSQEGILVAHVQNSAEGLNVTKDLLNKTSNKETFLLLSGGRTPKELYFSLAQEKKLDVGAVGLVDERFGKKFHDNSNEKMVQETGLLKYLRTKHIPFYPILENHSMLHPRGVTPEPLDLHLKGGSVKVESAKQYDEKLRELFKTYKTIAILGVGLDGHTAGIPALRNKLEDGEQKTIVWSYDNFPGPQKERISLTFKGLAKIELLIILVFGEDKKEALHKLFQDGPVEEIPARFLKQPEIASKTLLITDQQV